MEATVWESSSGGASGDDDNYAQDIKDEEECLCASGYLRKLQFRLRTQRIYTAPNPSMVLPDCLFLSVCFNILSVSLGSMLQLLDGMIKWEWQKF